jgi:MFS family permease
MVDEHPSEDLNVASETPAAARGEHVTTRQQERRVVLGTLVGTTIEWYDFFIYANAAALVLGPLFFSAIPPESQLIVSFATVGVSFLFRPLGAIVAGHLGDRIGRKAMLVATLLLMGGSTTLIGILPSAGTIGVWAPILLVILRCIQGFSAGGEWGGAALMAVESAPVHKRGLYGGFPQIGVPLGLLTATGVLAILSITMTNAQFLGFGWRIPFLLSALLIGVGMWIRLGVGESPVFKEMAAKHEDSKAPLLLLFRTNGKQVLLTALLFMGNGVVGYMITGGFVLAYSTTKLGLDRTAVLWCVMAAGVVWLVATLWSAGLSDRIGRIRTYQIGFIALMVWVFPFFWLIDRGTVLGILIAVLVLTIGIGFSYGPQAALFVEVFPAQIRYSGAGIGYALGAILGGAFAPTIAEYLLTTTGTTLSISAYLFIFVLIAFLATFALKDRTGGRLDAEAMDVPGAVALLKLQGEGGTGATGIRE